ncbi:MAG: hypothetical protein J07HX5_01206 [halophilic archaeon J07HX5]|nr:MAG: hypothetical protein J07HX5_01206 [halophilic archaeon J07HX5]
MLCKEETPADEQVALTSDEYLCRSCHGDLRTFKRTRPLHLWVTPTAWSSTKQMLRDQYDTQRSLLGELSVEYDEIAPLPSRQFHDE